MPYALQRWSWFDLNNSGQTKLSRKNPAIQTATRRAVKSAPKLELVLAARSSHYGDIQLWFEPFRQQAGGECCIYICDNNAWLTVFLMNKTGSIRSDY
jgi:hypothetical protein